MCLVLLYECWVSALRTFCLQTKQFADSPLNQLFTLLAKVFTECHGQVDSRDHITPQTKPLSFQWPSSSKGCPGDNTLNPPSPTDDII